MVSTPRGSMLAAAAVLLGAWLPAVAGEPVAPAATPIVGLRDCPNGGFALPGSRSCVRLGGDIRSSVTVGSGRGAGLSSLGGTSRSVTRLGTSARVDVDVRTPTELGPLRVFTSVRSRSPGADLR